MKKAQEKNTEYMGELGYNADVPIQNLLVDSSYQRPLCSKTVLGAIARKFNWAAFGRITVAERADGSMWIIDGQQRVGALKERGYSGMVPCVIFASGGALFESRMFLAVNVSRRAVRAITKFHASASCGESLESEVKQWMLENGFVVNGGGEGSNAIQFIGNLLRSWRVDSNSAKRAILLQRKINNGNPQHGDIFGGLWWLIHNGINVEDYADKLISAGGKVAMLREISKRRIEMMVNKNVRASGLAILGMINKGRKIRIMPKTMMDGDDQ